MEPFRALIADLLPPEQRTRGYAMQALFIGLGAVIASMLPWLLSNRRKFELMYRAPWIAIWPAVALSLAVFGFNMLGHALRDLLDPCLKGG